jgi:galactoside 2-L-fucosyltransferase 1/2
MSQSKTIRQKSTPSFKTYCIRLLFVILVLMIIIVSYFIYSSESFLHLTHIVIKKNYVTTTATTTVEKPIFQLQSSSIRCIVYPIDNAGELGNKMFLVASVYGLARLHSCHIYIPPEIVQKLTPVFIFDLSPFLISTSTFNSIVNGTSKMMKHIIRSVVCDYIPELTRPNAISPGSIYGAQGYWQSYLHFAKYGNDLRERIFVPIKPVLKKVSKFFISLYQEKKLGLKPQFSLENYQSFKKQLAQSNRTTWIGIHVRRSDFVDHNHSSSDEYLFMAIEYYTSHYSNAHFIVASDDKLYCKNLFRNRSNIIVTPKSFSRGEDIATLSLCEHSIITGGTFGWWAAYLANGQVVHDKVYPSGCERREYYYPPWFLIDGKVSNER